MHFPCFIISAMNDSDLIEKRIEGEEVFHGKLLHVFHDKVLLPNGHEGGRDLIRHLGAVCVVPLTDDGCVIMERQFRYPMDEVIWEIPAGKLDSKDEDRLMAAKRELSEETGYSAKEWISLGVLYPTPAYSDEKIWIYLAKGLEKGNVHLDEDEFIGVEIIPLEKLLDMVMDGEITDAKTQLSLLKAARYISLNEKA